MKALAAILIIISVLLVGKVILQWIEIRENGERYRKVLKESMRYKDNLILVSAKYEARIDKLNQEISEIPIKKGSIKTVINTVIKRDTVTISIAKGSGEESWGSWNLDNNKMELRFYPIMIQVVELPDNKWVFSTKSGIRIEGTVQKMKHRPP